MNREELRIHSFLRFGYFCDYYKQRAPIDFSGIDKSLYERASFEELVNLGVTKLEEAVAGLLQQKRENVLPLSGGLDSRLLLGALLQHASAECLETFTYGVAGSYDYEIGNSIAKEFGTRHQSMLLSERACSFEAELQAARRTDYQGVLFHHPPLDVLDRNYPGALFWSGYLGDAIAGSYLKERPSESLREAQIGHLGNRVMVKSIKLHRCDDQEFLACMTDDEIDSKLLTFDEQVLFSEAAVKFTAPLVLIEGYDFSTPFINTPWMDFMLSVPNRFRRNQNLMIEVGKRAFPKLFSLPSTNRIGHTFDTPDIVVSGTFWLNRVRKAVHQFIPGINWPNFQYNDFNESIRTESNLRQLVRKSVDNLRRRAICDWIDFDRIWRRHDRRIRNHGDALIILASLELVMKAVELDNRE